MAIMGSILNAHHGLWLYVLSLKNKKQLTIEIKSSALNKYADQKGVTTWKKENYTLTLMDKNVLAFQLISENPYETNKTHITYDGLILDRFVKDARDNTILIHELMDKISYCVSEKDIATCQKLIPRINELNDEELKRAIHWRSFREVINDCKAFPKRILSFLHSIQSIYKEGKSMAHRYKQKAQLLKLALHNNIDYMTAKEYVAFRTSKSKENYRFLFLSEQFDGPKVLNYVRFFLDWRHVAEHNFALVDLDVDRPRTSTIALPTRVLLQHYVNGVCLCDDIVANFESTDSDFVSFDYDKMDKTIKDSPRTLLISSCPVCPAFDNRPVPWACYRCKSAVELCFDDYFHCNCGYSSAQGYISFKCRKYLHADFIPNTSIATPLSLDKLRKLERLRPVNLLLIGQSGVGKSTWINALANYLKFDSVDRALSGDPVTLIANKFVLYDKDMNEFNVKVGQDANEDTNTGASATQACKSYVLYHKHRRITIIDTPGLGDTRGYEQDCDNVRDILEHIQSYPQIHGVCFLLLPDETRKNASLLYSVKEIMCYLHQSVAPNLYFLFTKARKTNYRPGETLQLIKDVMGDARCNIDFNLETMFCFDSESYRFLMAKKTTSIEFSEDITDSFKLSWKKSADETIRLITSAAAKSGYNAKLSIDIGAVRFTWMEVMREMISTLKHQSTDSIIKEIELCEAEVEVFKKRLYIAADQVVKTTSTPRLVCSQQKCCTLKGGASIYKTCHEPCYESNNFDTLQNVQLRQCPVLRNIRCTTCACSWETHMVINYEQKVTSSKVKDEKIENEIKKTNAKIDDWNRKLKTIENDKVNAVKTANNMSRLGKTLAQYIAQNALFVANNALEGYLEFLIHSLQVEANKTDADYQRIRRLEESKNEASQLVESVKDVKDVGNVKIALKDLEKSASDLNLRFRVNNPNNAAAATMRLEKRVVINYLELMTSFD